MVVMKAVPSPIGLLCCPQGISTRELESIESLPFLTHTYAVVNGFTSSVQRSSSSRTCFTASHLFILLECIKRTFLTRANAVVGGIFSRPADDCKTREALLLKLVNTVNSI